MPRIVAITLTNELQYTWAHNFDDFSLYGLPLGADFRRVELTSGVRWSVAEDTSVEADYTFSRYQPNSDAASGDYRANGISFEVTKKF